MKTEKLQVYPVGVSFYEDGISQLAEGDTVYLKHVPCEFNGVKYPNAIQVQNENVEQVGSIAESEDPKELQQRILKYLLKNELSGTVQQVSDISSMNFASNWTFSFQIELPILADMVDLVFETVKTFTGETLLYNDDKHIYKTLDGVILTGGSTWCKQFYPTFPMEKQSQSIAFQYGHSQKDIKAVWASNSNVSTGGGTTLHDAMQHYFNYRHLVCINPKTGKDKEYYMPNDPYYYRAVASFPDKHLDIVPEVFVSFIEKLMCGQIDALIKHDEKTFSVGDHKTGKEKTLAKKKQEEYFLQLGYYAMTLYFKGYTVKELILYYFYDGVWTVYRQDFKPLKELL